MNNRDDILKLIIEMKQIADKLTLNRLDDCAEKLMEIAPLIVQTITDFLNSGIKIESTEYKEIAQVRTANFIEVFNAGDLVGLADSLKYELPEVLEYIVKSE